VRKLSPFDFLLNNLLDTEKL